MISLVVIFCLQLNPYLCRELEMVPVDHETVSIPECMKGGMIGAVSFTLDHAEWQVKGYRCRERTTDFQKWLAPRVSN